MNQLVLPAATKMHWGWAGPPLGLLYLAAMTPEVDIIDGPLHGDPVFEPGEGVVGITVHSSTRKDALRLAADAKDAGRTVVVGGPHFNASFTSKAFEGYADYIIRGSGEMADRDWMMALQPDSVGCLGHTLVLPGTALWYKAVKAGYVSPDYWDGDEPYLVANRRWKL